MGYQNNICTLCKGELDVADYIADGHGGTYSMLVVHQGKEREFRTIMVCRDCGLVYAREDERDAS